jgi:hypothetical protein
MEPTKVLKLYRAQKAKEDNIRKVWKKCISYLNNFVDGELGQWDSVARAALKSENRPVISFNILKKYVNLVCGAQRKAKADEKVYPRDSESDPATAEILTDLLKYISDINRLEPERSKIFRDVVSIGRGFERCEWSDELDPLGEVLVRRVNPERVYLIGDIERYDLEDLDAIIEEIPMSLEDAIAQWPDSEDEIRSAERMAKDDNVQVASGQDYEPSGISTDDVYDKLNDKLIVLRTQYKQYKDVTFIQNEQTGERQPAEVEGKKTTKKAAKLAADLMIQTTGIPHKVVTRRVKYVSVCYTISNTLLDEEESPYPTWDITGYFGYIDGGMATGVAQDLLDPQDEKNKRHSQIIHILGTAAKNSFFYKEGAITEPQKVEKRLGKTGQLIGIRGDLNQAIKPIQSDLSAVPAIINMDVAATQEMQDISGISEASFGQLPGGVRSGRALQALQSPAETITSEIFDNFFVSRQISAKKIIGIIQKYYTTERRFRILGDYSSKFIPPELEAQIASGAVSVQDGAKIVTINKQQGEQKLNDVTTGRYDVIIDQVASNPTIRATKYLDLLNMRSQGIAVPGDLVVKAWDGPGRQELISRMAEEEQKMMAQQIMMSQMGAKPGGGKGSPPAAPDLMGNIAGGQFGQ